MEFREAFTQFIHENGLFSPDQPVLLAVSGGLDSVVMAHLFHTSGYSFGIAHCNFQLRGAESEGDEWFVRQLARSFDVPFFTEKFDTATFAAQHGLSVQMAARELRYRWFLELALEHHYPAIATAHHLNDSVETALLNFIRGTGLSGLAGIRIKWPFSGTPVWLLRPLLFASREHIQAYAQVCGLEWREDSSNAEDYYARNYLRHQLMPGMTALNPAFLATAGRNLKRISEARDNLLFLVRQFLNLPDEMPESGLNLDISRLKQLPAPRQAVAVLLKPLGFDAEQIRQVARNLESTGFQLPSKSGWVVLCDRGSLQIRKQENTASGQAESRPEVQIRQDDLMVRLPDGSALFLMPVPENAPATDGLNDISVGAASLIFPLTVRHWQSGDTFQPRGMGGKSQKIQDFFTNKKLSRFDKEQVWLLVNGNGQIIWVIGLRADERFQAKTMQETAVKIVFEAVQR